MGPWNDLIPNLIGCSEDIHAHKIDYELFQKWKKSEFIPSMNDPFLVFSKKYDFQNLSCFGHHHQLGACSEDIHAHKINYELFQKWKKTEKI